MKQDLTLHVQNFIRKLDRGLTQELEVEMMHFHAILSEREYDILKFRVINLKTFKQLAKREGVTEQKVRMVYQKAIDKLSVYQ